MGWRTVVVTGCAKLDYKMDYLVVRKQDQVRRVPLSQIGLLMIESTAVSLTAALLCELMKKKVKVIFVMNSIIRIQSSCRITEAMIPASS